MKVTAPKGNIPIGYVTVGGQKLSVQIDAEWLRYLAQDVFQRIGGVNGSSSNDLTLSQFEDAGIEEAKAGIYRLRDDLSQYPVAEVAKADEDTGAPSLAAFLETLTARVSALEQGVSP